ncbi:hypothetical protein BDY24DRAFT_419482 [Mrakia frigida]|uniref:uncharacterized protein n=1 Tax=Mrakia frigida TaxID=29902 RepID=UPI003FCC0A6A
MSQSAAAAVKISRTQVKNKEDTIPLLSIDETNKHVIDVQRRVDSYFLGFANTVCDDFPDLLPSARPVDRTAVADLVEKMVKHGLSTEQAPIATIVNPANFEEVKKLISDAGDKRAAIPGRCSKLAQGGHRKHSLIEYASVKTTIQGLTLGQIMWKTGVYHPGTSSKLLVGFKTIFGVKGDALGSSSSKLSSRATFEK